MCLRMFGIGANKAVAGEQTEGIVTDVRVCWWLKINTKPFRTHMTDGAVFPHIICFTYTVDGVVYRGKRYINWNKYCPKKGDKLTVYYEQEDVARYAVII